MMLVQVLQKRSRDLKIRSLLDCEDYDCPQGGTEGKRSDLIACDLIIGIIGRRSRFQYRYAVIPSSCSLGTTKKRAGNIVP